MLFIYTIREFRHTIKPGTLEHGTTEHGIPVEHWPNTGTLADQFEYHEMVEHEKSSGTT